MRVLFVCHGNICRSPMAEFILKAMVKAKGVEGKYYIESAAVSTEEIGNPIYPPAKRCLSQHGVWFDPSKRARQVTRADYDRFDRIICMDASSPSPGALQANPRALKKRPTQNDMNPES